MGLPSPVGTFSPEDIPSSPGVADMAEQHENHMGTEEEDSSKDSSLQSSLQDSSLTELEGKMASTSVGAGMSIVYHRMCFRILEKVFHLTFILTRKKYTRGRSVTVILRHYYVTKLYSGRVTFEQLSLISGFRFGGLITIQPKALSLGKPPQVVSLGSFLSWCVVSEHVKHYEVLRYLPFTNID